ncbi:MAG: DUF72 domain-containing protein [Thiohalobacterales bacterium]|nr:DUF72 domain-containing protein [Thiohalobacterales bacterium]
MTARQGVIHMGTSGWSYEYWKGPFYPPDLPTGDELSFYARHCRSVEINSSFYRLPEQRTLQHWYDSVPDDFVFAAKASRYITHMKKLREPERSLPPFLERVALLGDKLGPLLFQLPPRWRCNPARLAALLDCLDGHHRYAFEVRDHSWLNADIRTLLAQHNAAFCIYDLEGFRTPEWVTADFVYIRLHGPAGAYRGSYSRQALSARASRIIEWALAGKSVYCYFDNDELGHAIGNACSLQDILRRREPALC